MKAAEVKQQLFQTIEQSDARQLKEIYGLLQNYFNSQNNIEEWEELNEVQQAKLLQGIKQADSNATKSLEEVLGRLKHKYSIDG